MGSVSQLKIRRIDWAVWSPTLEKFLTVKLGCGVKLTTQVDAMKIAEKLTSATVIWHARPYNILNAGQIHESEV